tara:strand:+ start:1513 stop:2463 length:951 start_codon:yes stop_codon:yes gene_type:complete
MNKYLYIIGHQCSGKSLLKNTLLEMFNEKIIDTGSVSKLMLENLAQKYSINKFSEFQIENFIIDLYSDPRKDRWKNINSHLLKQMFYRYKPSNFYDIMNILFSCNAGLIDLPNDVYWVIDNRLMTNRLDEIINENQNSKIIHVIRNPRNIHYSIINERKDWYKKKQYNSIVRAIYWQNYLNYVSNYGEKFPDRIFTLRYEDLINDSNTTIKKVFEFIKIKNFNYHNNFLDLHSNNIESYFLTSSSKIFRHSIFKIFSGKFLYINHYEKLNLIYRIFSGFLFIFLVNPLILLIIYDNKFNLLRATKIFKLAKRIKNI